MFYFNFQDFPNYPPEMKDLLNEDSFVNEEDIKIKDEEKTNDKFKNYKTEEKSSSLSLLKEKKNHHKTNELFLLIKRGRYKKDKNLKKDQCSRIHDKYSSDNIMKKIIVNSLTFIVSFLNKIIELEPLNYKKGFRKLAPGFVKKIKKKNLESLKNTTIKEIICQPRNKKYKIDDENFNKELYKKIISKNADFDKIFEEKYINIFKIFFENNRKINLKNYGFKQDIVLDKKIKMFDDFLEKKVKNDEEYLERIYKFINLNFLPEEKESLNQK